jgi:hypothetical protein
MRLSSVIVCSALFLITIGCSSAPNKPPEKQQLKLASAVETEKKDPLLYTAKPCFTRMSDMAQRWSPDALPFHMESALNPESNGQDGKATVWRGLFASPSRGTFKTYTCSGSRLLDQPPVGITSTVESTSSPVVASLLFHPSFLQTDSDKAFSIAQQHGGANLTKKDPKQPVVYLLERDPKHNGIFWYVVYGTSQSDSKGIGVINASNGAFLRAGK